MSVLSLALRRHAAVYMADRFYRTAWFAFPLAIAIFLFARSLLPNQEAIKQPPGNVLAAIPSKAAIQHPQTNDLPDLRHNSGSFTDLYRKALASDLTGEAILRREASEGAAAAQFRMGNLSDPIVNKALLRKARTERS